MMKFYSCDYVQKFYLKFEGAVSNARVQFCCIPVKDKALPGIPLYDNPKQTLDELSKLRTNIINENKMAPMERKHTDTCASCRFYRLDEWSESKKITDIGLGMYPAPCQSKCCYCVFAKEENRHKYFHFDKSEHSERYEKVFSLLEYAKNNDWMASTLVWKINSGEISIHPYKDRIASLIGKDAAIWHTNGYVYDKNIATNLTANQNSCLHPSIDCGTPQTWKKIRGSDNFMEVMTNIAFYSAAASHPNQIYLKYIILPEINDNKKDMQGFAELVKNLRATMVEVACDDSKIHHNKDYRKKSVVAAAQLCIILNANGIGFYFGRFPQDIQDEIVKCANSILQK
ncbi:MAG: hypothetical protein FWC16_01285 [Defluviitaleaceae bacterium]|nr:hypothetical protein [Defluviitaleaceae bacterium]MCL2273537.1 hypothetical protein [Defluviitaleaceae bacterium]